MTAPAAAMFGKPYSQIGGKKLGNFLSRFTPQKNIQRGNIVKLVMITAAAAGLIATSAFAGATLSPNENAKSNGSIVGQLASMSKGNGDWVGGNGTSSEDQTTGPASRAMALGQVKGAAGENGGGNAGGSHR